MFRLAIFVLSFVFALVFFVVAAREARRRGWQAFDLPRDDGEPEDDSRK